MLVIGAHIGKQQFQFAQADVGEAAVAAQRGDDAGEQVFDEGENFAPGGGERFEVRAKGHHNNLHKKRRSPTEAAPVAPAKAADSPSCPRWCWGRSRARPRYAGPALPEGCARSTIPGRA